MARVVPVTARAIVERGQVFRPGRPVEIEHEEYYHHLIRTGRFRNADHVLKPIQAARVLPRLPAGAVVTVVREVGLGDVLMVLVVMRALAAKYPRLQFRLATGRAFLPLIGGLDFMAGAESLMDLRGIRGNVVDLRNIPERDPQRETTDRIDIFAKHVGVTVQDYSIPIAPVTKDDRARARELVGVHRTIALAVRGSTHVRTWPLENVRSFADAAAFRGWTVAVLDAGRFEMPDRPGIRNLTGSVSLVDTKAVIAASEFCVSPDSGLQHLAEAVGTKCLALYSTTPPALRIGHYRNVKALWRESLPCLPCFDRGCPAAPCMQIGPDVVLRALEGWDSLGMATNVDAPPAGILPVERVRIGSEDHIMESWPYAAAV